MVFPFISLLIPCYNESSRCHLLIAGITQFQREWKGLFEVVIVNDGSSDDTLQILENWKDQCGASRQIQIITQQNTGKGGAIQRGIPCCKGDFILTLDADMSTSPEELNRWWVLNAGFKQDEILIGSRELKESIIREFPLRKWIGNWFNRIIRWITGLHFKDTQCGFKLYPNKLAQEIFTQLKTMGWAHDVEVLCRAKKMQMKVKEMPLQWQAVEGSKVVVWKDSFRMFKEVLQIQQLMKKENNGNSPN
ncbi:MAG: glycosyltransferase [Chitinophagaceae bacterium]|jgi:dolichyl-phosphate beta-glucosyltransferase